MYLTTDELRLLDRRAHFIIAALSRFPFVYFLLLVPLEGKGDGEAKPSPGESVATEDFFAGAGSLVGPLTEEESLFAFLSLRSFQSTIQCSISQSLVFDQD
ncbi:unnamed protein product [Linum trigynum]|uniref:Uncharacterized protein n=1 Tax=Linum trigynum TaxID=586398 RepID=A0AAV2CZ00_9ROSI